MMNSTRLSKRKGAVWPLLLACLALMLAGLALAVDSALVWQARQELQVAADASALSAILELTDDQLLRHQPGGMLSAVDRAFNVVTSIGARHNVLGVPLHIETQDQTDLDVMMGFYDPAITGMQPAYGDYDNPMLNAIEATARRTRERGTPVGLFFTRLFRLSSADVAASATAVIDRHIYGFRPMGQINVPLMPIGLLSDPTAIEEESWEAQVDKPLSQGGGGLDQYAFDKVGKRWFVVGQDSKAGDGLPEFTLKLPLGSDVDDANGTLLHWGKSGMNTTLRQIESGLAPIDLQPTQGQLELSWDGMLPVEESAMPGGKQLEKMIELLTQLHTSGEARIWPLYVPGESNEDEPNGNYVMVRGFVAARVASIEKTESHLEVILQPTVLITGTALTKPAAVANQYLGKVKLVR